MRLSLAVTVIAASVSAGAAFVPSASKWGVSSKTAVFSTMEEPVVDAVAAPVEIEADVFELPQTDGVVSGEILPPTADEINARLNAQLEKLREKDRTSKQLSKEVGFMLLFGDGLVSVSSSDSSAVETALC
jgi:hypothetical protein